MVLAVTLGLAAPAVAVAQNTVIMISASQSGGAKYASAPATWNAFTTPSLGIFMKFTKVHWKSWGSAKAIGTGEVNGIANMATKPSTAPMPVTVILSSKHSYNGLGYYCTLTIPKLPKDLTGEFGFQKGVSLTYNASGMNCPLPTY